MCESVSVCVWGGVIVLPFVQLRFMAVVTGYSIAFRAVEVHGGGD